MNQIYTSHQPGDIVVVVPRWVIGAVGLLMLMMGLSISFLLLFSGFITQSILFTLAVLILVPVNLFVCYVTWRFYWYFILIGLLVQALCACTAFTGFTGIMGQMPSVRGIMGTPLAPVASVIAGTHILNLIFAVVLAVLTIGVMVMFYHLLFGGSARRVTYHYGDLYDIGDELRPPRRKRSGPRDLWQDD